MEKLEVIINSPLEDSESKLNNAIECMCKAMNLRFEKDDKSDKKIVIREESPYLSSRQMEEQILKDIDDKLGVLYNEIINTWLHIAKLRKAVEETFKLDGQIFINPRTGKPLTRKQWTLLKKELERGLGWVFKGKDLELAHATLLGKVLQSMSPQDAKEASLVSLQKQLAAPMGRYLADSITFAEQHAAEKITSLQSKARDRIASTIIEAQKNKWQPRQLEGRLFDEFADLNRDWQMIARTELATNENEGFLRTELNDAEKAKEGTVFMVGISAGSACEFCREHINGKVVVLLDSAPSGGSDQVTVGGQTYTAIWPGKSNVGRKRADWWVSVVNHPHCRCSWARYYPDMDEYNDRIQKLLQRK